MFNKKLLTLLVGIYCLTAFKTPLAAASLKQLTPSYDDSIVKIKELKKEEKKFKEQKKTVIREHHQSVYIAKEKNKLARFADQDGFIWFYDKDNKHTFFLSNFYPSSIRIWDMKFCCAEAAFQASKFLHKPEIAARFTKLDGEEAWKLAQKLSYQQRADWYQMREALMLEVLRNKFQQNSDMTELLLATGDAYLVEHSKRDAFWSDAKDGKGKNRLGHLLMNVRGERGGIGSVSKPAKYKKFVH